MHINSIDPDSRGLSTSSITSATNKDLSLRQTSFLGIISQCSEMQRVFNILGKVSRTSSTVLILGESGTGKELVAQAIHKISRRTGKLVPVNCGAIPEEILESELFGHEKGSFTGATQSRIGRFQAADQGTIFLDEIGEMSPKLQVKLLRVLQEKKVEAVGSTRSLDVDVRVVAATNKDLWEEVQAGRFREDLFYRLQVVPVELPALRQREGDVAILTEYFIKRASEQLDLEIPVTIDKGALSKFVAYRWPGNVRELENLIERLVIMSDTGVITSEDLPGYISSKSSEACTIIELGQKMPSEGLDFNNLVNQFETKLISMALTKTNWNKKAAAKLLQLNRTTLVEKIKKKGLEEQVEKIESEDEPSRPFADLSKEDNKSNDQLM